MRIRKALAGLAAHRPPATWPGAGGSRLVEFAPAGDNPGALGARAYVPADLAPGAALVVVLHGCTQTAEAYDAGTGWSRLADRAGCALLFPEQRRGNNPNLCFNWFQSSDIARRGGEAESIAQLVDAMVERHALDRHRIYVTGLSAGGAMAAVMLATHPDLFAGGAIIGGLPYGCAEGVGQALERMAGRNRGDSHAGIDTAARASGLTPDRWPTVSIWHGDADTTVGIANLDDLAVQWCGVHGVGGTAPDVADGANWTRRSWRAGGRTVVETWRIARMGHGVPIDPAGAEGLGSAGPYMLPVGIDSTATIARNWGLLPGSTDVAQPAAAARDAAPPEHAVPAKTVLPAAKPGGPHAPGIQAVIENALRSAGLMK